jgi:7,8-dihydropterin-6-yl-methyl-4-(beta-D-ribofuranosyl)aminobenzene 5'-phosphate synthase
MTCEQVDITVLVDDEAADGLTAEHGLSLWIEADGRHILFDTGQGAALTANAQQLDVPLEQTDTVVLSHGHYDHTGGLSAVLTLAPNVNVVLHPGATAVRYSIGAPGSAKPVGMSPSIRAMIERMPSHRITETVRPVTIGPSIGVTGPISRQRPFEQTSGPFFLDTHRKMEDPIMDDQALWIATPEGLVVCVGCCHAGLVNTLDYVLQISGMATIRAIIGGFHLLHADDDRLRQTVEALRSIRPDVLIPCHCTGWKAIHFLQDALGDHVYTCRSGARYHLGSG